MTCERLDFVPVVLLIDRFPAVPVRVSSAMQEVTFRCVGGLSLPFVGEWAFFAPKMGER